MERFLKCARPSRARYWAFGVFVLCLTGCDQIMQTPSGPIPTLTVSMEAMCNGSKLANGASVQAPVDIYLMPALSTSGPLRAGDTVRIDFFDGAKKLFSSKAEWHDAFNPSAQPGRHAAPMIMSAAGFAYDIRAWSNAPAGSHVLTARASGPYGMSAVSAPVNLTILP